MKNSLFALIALLTIAGISPKIMADEAIGTASRDAELIELHGAVTYTAIQQKHLTEYVEADKVTGFLFEENNYRCDDLNCANVPVSTWFNLVSAGTDGCNSAEFHAVELTPRQGAARHLTVTDHTKRTCDDYHQFTWEIEMNGYKTRYFGGNPEKF